MSTPELTALKNDRHNNVITPKISLAGKAYFWLARKIVIKKSPFWSKIAQIFFSKSKNFQSIVKKIQEAKQEISGSTGKITAIPSKPAKGPQTPWTKTTEAGFSVYNGELETTEGFGAYLDFCLKPGTKNFDNGGGSHIYNSLFLKQYVGVTNVVFDPYQLSEEENKQALDKLEKHDFDTATSNSVLNVIDTRDARLVHIRYSCKALKEGGVAYFKVFPGDKSGVGKQTAYGFLSNRLAESYQEEVEEVFGKGNVVTSRERHMLIAYKNTGCKQ